MASAGRQRGCGWHGGGNGDKNGMQAMAMATKRSVVIATKVAGRDEGNGKGNKNNGNGNKEGNGKEEGNSKQ
jgi:hypothetical protein